MEQRVCRRRAPAISAPDPGATALSAYGEALGFRVSPDRLGLWLPLLGVLALEIAAAFAVVLVRATAPWDTSAPAKTADVVSQPSPAEVSHDRHPGTPAKRQKAKWRDTDPPDAGTPAARGVQALLAPFRDGNAVRASQRQIARTLGIGRSTVNRLLREMADAGELVVATSKSGTQFALA